jgi:ADP-heptose:LPS heptosyltransferase
MLIFQAFGKWRHIPPAVLCEWFAGGLAAYAKRRVRLEPTPPTGWERILITGDNHVGDVLIRTPSLPALRRGFPKAELFFLTSASSAPLLDGNPNLDHVLAYANSDSPFDIIPEHQQRLRELRFDAALITNPVKYWPYLKFAVDLGIPNRAAFTHKGLSGWVTHAVPISFPDKLPAYFQAFVGHLTNTAPAWSLRPQVFLQEQDFAEAEKAWRSLGLPHQATVAAVFCTARQSAELWPAERWAACVRLLRAKLGAHIVLVGTAADRDHLTTVARQSAIPCHVLAGALTLRGLTAFLGECAVLVCPDSGSHHLGNAANTPVVFLRNLAFLQEEVVSYCGTDRDAIEAPGGRLSRPKQQEVLRTVSAEHVSNLAVAQAGLKRSDRVR